MNWLGQLTLRGSLMFLLVATLERLLGAKISARARRFWWLLVPLAFLLAVPVPMPASWAQSVRAHLPSSAWTTAIAPTAALTAGSTAGSSTPSFAISLLPILLTAGAATYLATALARTRSVLRRWGGERLSTNPDLLDVLEDCKREAGITAPIGLVVSEAVPAPVILGWVRPRILLPTPLAASLSREQLRSVLFHELAHFRACDVPLNWLFTAVCTLHWFNPLAHLAFRAWTRFREEAADETAITLLKQPTGLDYGETLLQVLRGTAATEAPRVPFSALAIVESIHQLKKRLLMIKHYQHKSPRSLLIAALLTVIALGMFLRPMRAAGGPVDANAVAANVMQSWLQEIDAGKYAQSWTDAAPLFQKAVTSEGWVTQIKRVRDPLGKCLSRKLASAALQTISPDSATAPAGDYIMAQYETSFAGLKYAVETVSFVKAPDGTWKAAGYYIKPKI